MSSVDGGDDVATSVINALGDSTSTPAHASAAKDRECPYCHEWFTSSSLGRHLDQFVKEQKPKPPDGKHDVEEIRKLRGVVTRRQARSSSGLKREGPSHRALSSTPGGGGGDGNTPSAAKRPRLNGPDSGIFATFNQPNWLTTGVIADPSSDETPLLPRLPSNLKVSFEKERRQFLAERDEGRAAKLALTEVIDSIKASVVPGPSTSPFPFDFLAQPFPTLVLHLLPAQRTIASPQIIPSADAWPIDPPTETHLSLLRDIVSHRLAAFRREQSRAPRTRRSSDDSSRSRSRSASGSPPPAHSEQDLSLYTTHLENAHAAWASLPTPERTRLWHLSALRAFVQEQHGHEATRKRLEEAEQHLAHQAAQVKRLSSLQQPREFTLNPTAATPIPPEAAHAVVRKLLGDSGGAGARALSADALIAKWTPGVRENRGFQRPLQSIMEAAAATLAAAAAARDELDARDAAGAANGRDASNAGASGMVGAVNGGGSGGGAAFAPNGARPRRRAANGAAAARDFADFGAGADLAGDPDAQSADASGEDDDDDDAVAQLGRASHLSAAAAALAAGGLDADMLDPKLRAGAGGNGGAGLGGFGAATAGGGMLGRSDQSPKDDGEFGAESLLARVGAELGNTPSGGVRRRSGRR